MPAIKNLVTAKNMMQNEKVQDWVNSLPVQNTVQNGDDADEINFATDELEQTFGNARTTTDDLALGTEATFAISNNVDQKPTAETHSDTVEKRPTGSSDQMMMGPSPAPVAFQLMRQKLLMHHQDSCNSESSSHLTIDSLDQILLERRGDPEKILENLGFLGKFVDNNQRVPERFLTVPSRATGISTEKFLNDNPLVKDYLEQKNALHKPFEATTLNNNNEESNNKTNDASEGSNNACGKMANFRQVASTVAMIKRFRGLVRKLKSPDSPEANTTLVEPVLRQSSKGSKFWSILSLENCNFLDRMGYYEKKLSEAKDSGSKFYWAIKKLQVTGGKQLSVDTSVITDESEAERETRRLEKLDEVLKSRSPTCVKDVTENTVTENTETAIKKTTTVEVPAPIDLHFSVPQRFLSSKSSLFGPVQEMSGESVSELVRRNSECPSQLLHLAASSQIQKIDVDVNSNTLAELPEIKINSVRSSVSSNPFSDDSFDYEWQRNSLSSSATDDSISLDLNDCLPCFGLTIDDVGEQFLMIPSDTASVISSNTLTLHDPESIDHASDQDTSTDILQSSQGSELLRDGKIEEIDSNNYACHLDDQYSSVSNSDLARQPPPNRLSSRLRMVWAKSKDLAFDASELSDDCEKQDDNLPQAISLPSKIKGALWRQGSSQSDSSGFADSDHVDWPDIYSSNRVRYSNRQLKLDTINSLESTSMEEESLERDSYQSQQQSTRSTTSHHLKTLRGNHREEQHFTKHSIHTQTDWNSFSHDQENVRNQRDKEYCEVSEEEQFLSQPVNYTTRLYIDSLASKTQIPLVESAEVMLIINNPYISGSHVLDRNVHSGLPTDQPHRTTKFSSVDVEVVDTKDGHQRLNPLLYSYGESAFVKQMDAAAEQCHPLHKGKHIVGFRDEDSSCDVIRHPFQIATADISTTTLDLTDHQILHSMLKQSVFVSPQSVASLLPPAHWSTFGSSNIGIKQHLVEEVRLLQHALQKYRLEMRFLQMQAKKLYTEEKLCLLPEERDNLVMLEELQDAISKEIDCLDTQLSQRMKLVISAAPDDPSFGADFSCLSVVQQMAELLKEQLYHSNIINGMSTILPAGHCSHPSDISQHSSTSNDNVLLERITLLEAKMEEQSRTFEVVLSNALKQIQEMMQHHIQSQTTES